MSLILLYRSCLTADRSVGNSMDQPMHDLRASKLYWSEDKQFAGAACGLILDLKQWETVRTILDLRTLAIYRPSQPYDAHKAFVELYKNYKGSTSLVAVYDNEILIVEGAHDKDQGMRISITSVEMDQTYVGGLAEPPARVLINSGLPIDQERFFRIVNHACPYVTKEFDLIELKEVVGSPWAKEHKTTKANLRKSKKLLSDLTKVAERMAKEERATPVPTPIQETTP